MKRMLAVVSCVMSGSVGSVAANLTPGKKPPAAEAAVASCKETKESTLPPDIFGFGSGSEVADRGSMAAGFEYGGSFGQRGGSFAGHSLKMQYSYGLAPCLEIGPSLSFGLTNTRDRMAGLSDRSAAFGGHFEIKYKLLGRAMQGVGLTFVTEPGIGQINTRRRDSVTPFSGSERARNFNNAYKLAADFAVVPDKIFGALGIEYGHVFDSPTANGLAGCLSAAGTSGHWCRRSNVGLKVAAVYKLADPLFIGAELQHLRAYDGAFLNKLAGQAWFVGPNVYWEAVPGKLTVNAAWATQVAGKARGLSGALDTTNFNRHLAKLKFAYSF